MLCWDHVMGCVQDHLFSCMCVVCFYCLDLVTICFALLWLLWSYFKFSAVFKANFSFHPLYIFIFYVFAFFFTMWLCSSGFFLLEEVFHCLGVGFDVSYTQDTTQCLSWLPLHARCRISRSATTPVPCLLACPHPSHHDDNGLTLKNWKQAKMFSL